jgi:deazaflavin-dependent oxidoreductase (nitroreductase family)
MNAGSTPTTAPAAAFDGADTTLIAQGGAITTAGVDASDSSAALRLPPRPLISTFWKLHRTAYRITGGRFGLARPREGAKFGMMRLQTVGRRSGQLRTAIVGYYEDGPNLVTLAMNGWGEAEPAWWLNLQTNPEALVGLADGSRVVRHARAAAGPERERLWARFRDFPGWGEDLGALAARRTRQTAIVVLEPGSAG